MTVSGKLGAALTARRWWCQPGEPILWAVWQVSWQCHVTGLDENGLLKKSSGSRFASGTKRAAGAVAGSIADVALTAAFGGGDDGKRPTASAKRADLTVFGDNPDCAAVRLHRTNCPDGFTSYEKLWVLTPARLGVLLPRYEPKSDTPSASSGSGGLGQFGRELGRTLVSSAPETFGKNEPGKPIRDREVTSWLEFSRQDIAGWRLADSPKSPEHARHCALLLADGSGFVLDAGPGSAQMMVEALNGWNPRGNRG